MTTRGAKSLGPAGGRADGRRAAGERAEGERAEGERAEGERAEGERAEGGRGAGGRTAAAREVAGRGGARRAVGWAALVVTLGGCAADPPLPQAAPPDPPAACVLDTTALANATHVSWTPDQSTANDTRCVYDAGPNAATPAGPAFLTVSLLARTQADAAAERESLAQLCTAGSRVDVNKADGGFVCRFDGDLVYGALVRGDQVVQVATAAIPTTTASAALATAISDQLANLPAR